MDETPSYAVKFVAEHFIIDAPRHAYLHARLKCQNDGTYPVEHWVVPGRDKTKMRVELNQMRISFQTKIRFAKAVSKAKDKVKLYIYLAQLLNDNAIKYFFYDVWIAWQNEMTRHNNNREENERRYLIKHHRIPHHDEVHRAAMSLTSGMNRRERAIEDGRIKL